MSDMKVPSFDYGQFALATRFEVTEEHVLLLKRLNFIWNTGDGYGGAPMVDWNRPYGNSSWRSDVAEIIGFSPIHPESLTDEQLARIDAIHMDMPYVLQILTQAGQITPGVYVRDEPIIGTWRRHETILRACKVNNRGLKGFFFADRNGRAGFLNKSSAAEEPCIWLGMEEKNGDLHALHLNLELVRELLPHLQRFAETEEGDLS